MRSCDGCCRCTATEHLGPYWIDATDPGAVSGLTSTSHAVGAPSNDPTVDLSWTAAPDNISADLKDGVLELRLPKKEAPSPKQISVSVGKK